MRRRVRENHGKGLGLFFVGEIVKGYDGLICIDNIDNRACRMTLHFEFENGDIHTDTFDVQVEDKLPVYQRAAENIAEKSLDWTFNQRLRSVEVSSADSQQPQKRLLTADNRNLNWVDPQQPVKANIAIFTFLTESMT